MTANTNTDLRNGVTGELGAKAPCLVATTANITLEGLQTVNGIALAENDIVLVRSQTNKTQNGIYIASTSSWERAVWFDDELDAVPGTLVLTTNGSEKSHTLWETICDDNPIQFGVSEIEFQFFQTSGGEGNYLVAANNLDDVENASTSRTNLGVAIGSDVQAYNANLQSIASLTLAANKLIGSSGAATAALYTLGIASGNIPQVGTTSATESLAGLAEVATQGETNAGISDATIVTPLKLITWYNNYILRSSPKAWASFAGTGSSPITPTSSYNISSIVKNSTGEYTISFTTPFAAATYCAIINWKTSGTSGGGLVQEITKAVGSYRFYTTNTSGSAVDAAKIDVVFFGDQ